MKRFLVLILTLLLLTCLVACSENDSPLDPPVVFSLYTHTIEDYRLFLEKCSPMPKWFISYDEVSFLGEFVSFEFEPSLMGKMKNGKYENFFGVKGNHDAISASYNLKDATGYEYTFAYYHWYLDEEPKETYDDVRVNESDGGSKFITWMYMGTEFIFFWLEDYPENATDTFVSRLLNPDTVDAAVAEFNLRVKGY